MTERRTDPQPPEAWWSEADQEWVLGDRDEDGRLIGPVRYWDTAGRFICESEHAAGRPHGISRRYDHPGGGLSQECRYVDGRIDGVRRFHRPPASVAEPQGFGYGSGGPWNDTVKSVCVYECVYEDGDLIGTRFLDADGVEVHHSSGSPVPPRPDGVAPTASHTPASDIAWLFTRRCGEDSVETVEVRRWWAGGTLQSEQTADGVQREFYSFGILRCEGRRVVRDDVRPKHGTWRYYDAYGRRRRESVHDSSVGCGVERTRTLYRMAEEANGRGVMRSGPVEDDVEVGLWQVRDADGALVREVRLGHRCSDAELLASPAAADRPYSTAELCAVLADADADDPDGAAAQLARIRLAAHEGAEALVPVTADERAWPVVEADGPYWYDGIPGSPLTWRSSMAQVIHAVRWGEPAGPTLAELARRLFHGGHPHAALDVIDAALRFSDEADWHRTRAVLLRALGRDTDADTVVAGPDHVDQAAARLLLTIRERPADNGLRLAYAELVAASHPEHAHLVTTQCGGNADDEDAAVAAYLAVLPEEVRDVLTGSPERGFVRTVTDMEAETFLRHHDAIFRAAPEDDYLELQFAGDHLAEISLLPALSRYRTLRTYDSHLDRDAVARLARSPYLRQLESLALPDTHLDDEDLTALLTSHSYPRLRELDVSASRYDGQNWTIAGLMRLPDAAFAPYLESLGLGRRSLDDLDNSVVTVLRALPKLTTLTLESWRLGDEALTGLSVLPNRFTMLDLSSDAFTAEGVDALVNSPATANLQRLTMKISNHHAHAAMLTLLRGRQLGALRTLRLSGDFSDENTLLPGGGLAFADAVFTRSLEELSLFSSGLGPDGAAGLAAAPFEQLRHLALAGCAIRDEGAVALADAPALATLRRLDLSSNQIGDAGAFALAESPHLTGIEGLSLRHNWFGDRGVRALRERFGGALDS